MFFGNLLTLDLVLQGDLGEKGPEGAPGKDGSRVSQTESVIVVTPSVSSLTVACFSGFNWTYWAPGSIWTQRCKGEDHIPALAFVVYVVGLFGLL